MVPLNMRFDSVANVQGSNVVHLPKLFQGAPYSFGIRIRNEDDSYRNFSTVVGMRWRVKLAPADRAEIFVLTKSDGNFTVTDVESNDGSMLTFVITADDWEGVVLPKSSNHLEMDVPFSFVMEFLDAEGVVVERFAQGSGLISADLFS